MEGSSSGGKGGFEFIRVDLLAKYLGASDAGLRFLLGLVSGYPFGLGYNFFLSKQSPNIKHLYCTVCGLLLSYFCFAEDTFHLIVTVLVTYLTLAMIGGSLASVLLLFAFQMSYLILGYIFCSSDSYDIKWTTPQCVMCLRLIGLAWDCYDGQKKWVNLSQDRKETAFHRAPTLLETFGYCFFFGSYLAGPQIPFKRYMDFIEDKLIDKEAEAKGPSRISTGFKRFLCGFLFVILFTLFEPSYRTSKLISRELLERSFFQKNVFLFLWCHVFFFKYIFVWTMAEGICMITGLSYNGKTEDGLAKWDGVKNISIYYYFTGCTYESMVKCFNINTNQWVLRYIFKRLRFLGNKDVSHMLTLAFLAIWHGFYVGYFFCFTMEFVIVHVERQMHNTLYKLTNTSIEELPLHFKIPVVISMWFVKWLGFAFCVASFAILRWRRFKKIYFSLYFYVVIICIIWHVSYPLVIKPWMEKKMADKERKEKKEQ